MTWFRRKSAAADPPPSSPPPDPTVDEVVAQILIVVRAAESKLDSIYARLVREEANAERKEGTP